MQKLDTNSVLKIVVSVAWNLNASEPIHCSYIADNRTWFKGMDFFRPFTFLSNNYRISHQIRFQTFDVIGWKKQPRTQIMPYKTSKLFLCARVIYRSKIIIVALSYTQDCKYSCHYVFFLFYTTKRWNYSLIIDQ